MATYIFSIWEGLATYLFFICEGLFFAGEVLNIDGVTGGFNFQHCWTSAWVAGNGIPVK